MSPIISKKTYADWLRQGIPSTLYVRADGSLETLPDNLFENQYGIDLAEDDEPVGWDLSGMPEPYTGDNIWIAGKSQPPRLRERTRQTTSPIPIEQSAWVASQALIDGVAKTRRSSDIPTKPLPPRVNIVPTNTRGFRGGTYGYAYGFESATGRTPPSGIAYVTVVDNNTITVTLPDSYPVGTIKLNLYLTKRGGGDGTLRLQRSLHVARLRGKTEYVLTGPWRAGKKPPAGNQSGFGKLPEPHIPRDAKVIHSAHDLKAGVWRFAYQLENRRGRSLLSVVSEQRTVAGEIEHYRVKEPIDSSNAEAYFELGTSPAEHASMPEHVDPRSLRPEGKLEGNTYYGEEIDHEEGLLVSTINALREERGLNLLVLNKALNRAAYRGTDPGDEGYSGIAITLRAEVQTRENALEDFDTSIYLSGDYEAVGVARDPSGWTLIVGDDAEYDEPEELVCEHIGPDGSIYRHRIGESSTLYADAGTTPQGWDNVNNHRLHWSYSGSHSSAVAWASNAWDAGTHVDVASAASGAPIHLAIHDASLPPDIAARTYSDGRTYLDSQFFAAGTTNAKQAVSTHEMGHSLGFDHVDPGAHTSVMQPGFNVNATTAPDTPTSWDQQRYTNTWGTWGSGTDGGTGGTGGGGTTPDEGPEFRWVWKTRTLSVMKNASLHFKLPPKARHKYRRTRWVPWVSINDVWYRVYNIRSRLGPEEQSFSEHETVEISGVTTDNTQGKRIVLIQSEQPTEDTSVIEAPDPTSLPETPVATGSTPPGVGNYYVSTTRVTDSGAETQLSDPAIDQSTGVPPVNLTLNNMMRISPVRTVNLLRNAEFSEVNSNGKPEDWTATNTSVVANPPGTGYWVDDGVLNISTTSTSSIPRVESDTIPVQADTVLTIAGTIGATNVATGSTADVGLVEYNDANVATTTSLSSIAANLTGEKDFSVRYGGTGTAFASDTTSVAIRVRLTGTTVAGTFYVKHLRVLPFASDVRKVADPGQAEAPFDADPTTAVPGQSYARVGPSPSTPADLTGVDPSLGTIDFESGSFPTAPWTFATSGTISSVISTTSPIYATRSWLITKSTTTNASATATRTVSSGDRDQGSFAERYLIDFVQLATRDTGIPLIRFIAVGGQFMGQIRYKRESGNHRLYLTSYKNNGDLATETRILGGITAGMRVDLELKLTGMASKEGTISASLGVNGAKRDVVATYRGRDFTSRNVGTSVIPISPTNNLAAFTFKIDQIVPSKAGDITTRETPVTPTGYTAPGPDRPTTSSVIRRYDPDGVTTSQLYVFVAPGEGPVTIPLLERPIAVKPGSSYTFGVQSRWSVFSRDDAALTSEGLNAYLQGEDREDLLMGSAHGTGMTGEVAWTGTDNYMTFTVPTSTTDDVADTYLLFRPELVLEDGVYVFQDFLLAEGNLTLQADRDAKRGYGRQLSSTFTSVLDTRPPDDIGPRFGTWWASLGVREGNHELPAGVSLAVRYSSSFDNVGYYDDSDTPEFVIPRRYAKIDGTLTSDGRYSPLIPSGGAYAETWHPIGNLLRGDRSEFSGCVWVGNSSWAVEYEDTEVERIGGHTFVNELTEEITRIYDLPLEVGTEAAAKEIENRALKDEFWIELPQESDTVAGMAYRVRFRERPRFEAREIDSSIRSDRRRIYASATVAEVEVLEAAPLRGPLYGYIPNTADAPLPVAVG